MEQNKPTQKVTMGNGTLIQNSFLVRFLDAIVMPQYQVIAVLICCFFMFLLSDWGLQKQVPLERYPLIHNITHENYREWGGEPAIIHVGFQLNNVPQFKILDDQFAVVGKIWFLFDPQLVSLATVSEFSFENQTDLEKSAPEVKLINDMVFAEFNIRLTFNTELTHRAFPFDNHRMYLNLINSHISPNEALFASDNSQFVISEQVYIPEWTHKNPCVYTGYTEYILDNDDTQKTILYPKVLFSIDFDRAGLRHVFIMLLPLFLICAVGMIAIGAQKTIGGKALDINVAGAASIIAYRFVIESMSPKVSYLMVADYIFIFFLVFACMQLIFSAITYQQPPKASWSIVRGVLFFLFYIGFLILWYYLVMWWAPSYSTVKSPQDAVSINAETEFYRNLDLPIDSQKQSIKIGLLADLSRIDRDFGRQIKNGTNARLYQAKKNNELTANILLNSQDNQASRAKAREIMQLFIAEKTPVLLSPMGSVIIQAYLDFAKQKKGVVLFPITGSKEVRNPDTPGIINFRASFADEGAALAHYAIENLQAQRITVLYEDTPFGIESLLGLRMKLEKTTIKPDSIIEIPYEKYDISFERQIEELKKNDPDTIILFASGVAAIEFINQVGIEHLVGKNLLGTSHINQSRFHNITKSKGLTFITSNLVPSPHTSDLPIAQEFRTIAKEYEIPIGAFSFEAYINTDILLHIISKITGDITPEKIIQTAESFKKYNHKGLVLDFNSQTRELSPFLWIDTGTGIWLQQDKNNYIK